MRVFNACVWSVASEKERSLTRSQQLWYPTMVFNCCIYQYYYSSIIIIIIIICTSHFFFFFNCEELIEHQPSNFEGSVLVISKDREELFPQVQLSNKIFIIKLAFKTSRKQTNPRGCLNNCGITHLNFQRNHSQQGWKSETPATTYDEIYTGYGEITPWYWSTFVKISLLDTLS